MDSKQVARLFPDEPVPCPVAGLADALEGYASLSHAAIKQIVFCRFSVASLRIADSRRLMEAGAKPVDSRTLRHCSTIALLSGGRASAEYQGEEILQRLFVSAPGVHGADGVDREGCDGRYLTGR
jgi:hypothetical protein